MSLFCTAIRRNSVSLLRFTFHSHVQVFSCVILLICRLKCPLSCFSSHFFYLVNFVPLIILLSVVFLVAVISHFKNGPENLTRWTAQVVIPFIRFMLFSLVSSGFYYCYLGWFYGLSTIVAHPTPNPLYTHISNI